MQNGKVPSKTEKPKAFGLSYLVNEHPPWYLCIWLAFQVGKYNGRFALLVVTTWSSDSPRLIGDYNITLFLTLFLIFSAFPNHAWINIGDSLHFTNSNVFSRQQTCHQRNPKHYILRIWNCYIVTDYVWSQVNVFFCCNFGIANKGKRS